VAVVIIFVPALTFVGERLSRSYKLDTLEIDCQTVPAEQRSYKTLLCFDLPSGKALDPKTGEVFSLEELFPRAKASQKAE
jgi:hypothetical protein